MGAAPFFKVKASIVYLKPLNAYARMNQYIQDSIIPYPLYLGVDFTS
jgi:hypothetical protein